MESVHEETKAKHDIWKPFIFRGKVWDERKKIQGFFMACLTFASPCRWKTKSPQEAAETPPPLGPPHSSPLPSLRRGTDRAPSHQPRTLSKTQPTSWRRTAMYNPSLTAGVRGGKKKKTRFAQNLFFYAACVQISSCFKKEKYISIELRRKRVCCDYAFWFSYANSCVDVFFILMYNMYIFALKLLIEMLISCIFVNLNCENLSENILQ